MMQQLLHAASIFRGDFHACGVAIRRPQYFDFISRVTAYVDPEIEKLGAPYRHAARVKVTAKDGRSVEKLLHHRRGSPEKPLKPEEIEYKFRNVVSGCVSKANIDKLVALVARLDTMTNTNELTALMGQQVTTP